MSPLRFSIMLYNAIGLRRSNDDCRQGADNAKIGRELFKHVRFADDQAMVANQEAGLKKQIELGMTWKDIYQDK